MFFVKFIKKNNKTFLLHSFLFLSFLSISFAVYKSYIKNPFVDAHNGQSHTVVCDLGTATESACKDNKGNIIGYETIECKGPTGQTYPRTTVPCANSSATCPDVPIPKNLRAENITQTSAVLRWDFPSGYNTSNITNTKIFGSWSSECDINNTWYCGQTGNSSTSYTIGTGKLKCGTTYYFNVEPYNYCGKYSRSAWETRDGVAFTTKSCTVSPPTLTLSGETDVCLNQEYTYNFTSYASAGLDKSYAYWTPVERQAWVEFGKKTFSGQKSPVTWSSKLRFDSNNFKAGSSYYVVGNNYDKKGLKCSGNPFLTYPYDGNKDGVVDWYDCDSGNNDVLKVNVKNCSTPKEPAILLGRVYKENSACTYNKQWYGTNCGTNSCMGPPNYSVSWVQDETTAQTNNNQCFAGAPRYTFEYIDPKPLTDSNGSFVDVKITVNSSNPKDYLTNWNLDVTDSNGRSCGIPSQEGSFNTLKKTQQISVKVYKKGDCRWNHLWFFRNNSAVNNAPVCSSGELSMDFSPSKQYYNPGEQITIKPNAFDPDGDALTITGWKKTNSSSSFLDLSNPFLVKYKAPQGTTRDTISYTVSDGIDSVTCSRSLDTRVAFSCNTDSNACVLDSTGPFTDLTSCEQECYTPTKFSCDPVAKVCKEDPNGTYSTYESCSADCVPQEELSCSLTYDSSTNILTSRVNNPNNDAGLFYDWFASAGGSIFDTNCIDENCALRSTSVSIYEGEYTPPANYNVSKDTISFKILDAQNNVKASCLADIPLNGPPQEEKKLEFNFDKPVYNVSQGASEPAKLSVRSTNFVGEINVGVSCNNNSASATFDSTNSSIIPVTLSNGSVQYLDLSILGNSTGTCTLTGTLVDDTPPGVNVLPAQATVNVLANSAINFKYMEYKGTGQKDNAFYCNEYKTNPGSFEAIGTVFPMEISSKSVDETLNSNQLTPYTTVPNTDYTFSPNLSSSPYFNNKDVRCWYTYEGIKTNASLSIKSPSGGNTREVVMIVAPERTNSWFNALGADFHGFSTINSEVYDGNTLLSDFGGLSAGVLSNADKIQSPTEQDKKSSSGVFIENQTLDYLYEILNRQDILDNITTISTLNSISSNGTYLFKGDLSIDTNFNKGYTPIIIVQGNVTISPDVENIRAIILASESISVESILNKDDVKLKVIGGLYSKSNISFERVKFEGNETPIEQVQFDPSVYFINQYINNPSTYLLTKYSLHTTSID